MGFNKSVERLRRGAQSIIDQKDATIIRLQREIAILRAENADLRVQLGDANLAENMRILRNRIPH